MIERASGRGATSARRFNNPLVLFEEFWTGISVDQNMLNLVLDAQDEQVLSGECFWQASGLAPEHDVESHFTKNKINSESLQHPSRGDYKMPHLNF